MPLQQSGRLHGFQFWINLPAAEKMKPAAYRDIQPEEIPPLGIPGGEVRIIAGTLETTDGQARPGPIQGLSTAPLFLDVRLEAGQRFGHPVPEGHTAFLYPYAGELTVGADDSARPLATREAGILSPGARIEVTAGQHGASFLLLAARPLGEPVVQYGPFVMNTREEIEQALDDYRNGTLA